MPPDANDATQTFFGEVLARILQAEERGEKPDVADYQRQYPDLADDLAAFFRDRGGFDRAAALAGLTAGPPAGTPFGGYDLIRVLGRGGMGVVYLARQRAPEREVALKIVRSDRLRDQGETGRRSWMDRFRREAELLAALGGHGGVVQLLDYGEQDGQAYFTMPLVTGGSLAARLGAGPGERDEQWARRRAAGQRAAADLVRRAALAVSHAHQHGVLHRDLKPANVLLDDKGEPVLTDFGLARRLAGGDGLTQTGAVLGTAAYMAPEQARGGPQAVSMAADVYSLGAILYEMLAGRPPFDDAEPLVTLMRAQNEPVVPPERFTPGLDRGLGSICLKCLEKEPQRRYATAAELAADLDNWLNHRPLVARPAGAAERLWLFARRRPVPVAAGLLVALTILVSLPLVLWSRSQALDLAQRNGDLAILNEQLAKEKQDEAQEAVAQRDRAQGQTTRLALDAGLKRYRDGDSIGGTLWLARALELAPSDADDLSHACRIQLAHRASRGPVLLYRLEHPEEVLSVAVSPDGRAVFTGCADSRVRAWSAETGKRVSVSGEHGGPRPRGQSALPPRAGQVFESAVRPDGTLLTTVTRGQSALPPPRAGQVFALAVRPDGTLLATVTGDPDAPGREAIRNRTVTRDLQREVFSHRVGGPPSLPRVFDPNQPLNNSDRFAGNLLEVPGGDRAEIRFRPADIRPESVRWAALADRAVWAVAFSPDGKHVVTGEGRASSDRARPVLGEAPPPAGRVDVWNSDTWRRVAGPLNHDEAVLAVAYSPDGKHVLTGAGSFPRVWDLATGKVVNGGLVGGQVVAVGYHPAGRAYFGLSQKEGGATLCLFGITAPHRGEERIELATPTHCIAYSPDGRFLAVGGVAPGGVGGQVLLLDGVTGKLVGAPLPHPSVVQALAFSPSGDLLVTASVDRHACVWRVWPGAEAEAPPFAGPTRTVPPATTGGKKGASVMAMAPLAVTADGGLTVQVKLGVSKGPGAQVETRQNRATDETKTEVKQVGRWTTECEVWVERTATRERVGPVRRFADRVRAAAFSPDGSALALGCDDGTASVTAVGTGARRGDPLPHPGPVLAVAFSNDGKVLLTGCGDRQVRLDPERGELLAEPLALGAEVTFVVASPADRLALAGGRDGTAQVFEIQTGKPLGLPLSHAGATTAAFSPSGRLLLTGGEDSQVRLWDAATGLAVGGPLRLKGPVLEVAFLADDKARTISREDGGSESVFVAQTFEPVRPALSVGTLREWSLPRPLAGDRHDLARGLEAWVGAELTPLGQVKALSPAQAAERQARAPRLPAFPADWHAQVAERAEQERDWFAVRWHLSRLAEGNHSDTSSRLRLAAASLRLGRIEEAQREANAVCGIAPAELLAWRVAGEAFLARQQWAEAIGCLNRVIDGDKGDGEARLMRAVAHVERGEWKQAEEDFDAAARHYQRHSPASDRLQPLEPLLWSMLAWGHLQNGNTAKANELIEKAEQRVRAVREGKQGVEDWQSMGWGQQWLVHSLRMVVRRGIQEAEAKQKER